MWENEMKKKIIETINNITDNTPLLLIFYFWDQRTKKLKYEILHKDNNLNDYEKWYNNNFKNQETSFSKHALEKGLPLYKVFFSNNEISGKKISYYKLQEDNSLDYRKIKNKDVYDQGLKNYLEEHRKYFYQKFKKKTYYYFFGYKLGSFSFFNKSDALSTACSFLIEKDLNNTDLLLELIKSIFFVIGPYIIAKYLKEIEELTLKSAITSIIVDSFAHNIGAHSLSTIKWWIEKRVSKFLNEQIKLPKRKNTIGIVKIKQDEKSIENNILEFVAKRTSEIYKQIGINDMSNSENITTLQELIEYINNIERFLEIKGKFDDEIMPDDSFNFPVPLDHVFLPFFKFLREKSEFWSGAIRDISFGGEVKNLYHVLWNDLISNPMYLGTIAYSENIKKITFYIRIRRDGGEKSNLELFEFAKIDMSVIEDEMKKKKEQETGQEKKQTSNGIFSYNENGTIYNLIKLGKNHKEVREIFLQDKYNVYFPNGIIGEHAFFTVVENVLRNVKHYDYKDFNGEIKFVFEIDELQNNNWKDKLLKIGLFLNHPLKTKKVDDEKLDEFLKEESKKIIVDRISGKPKLGGNSQDKICTAMLLNGTFISVDKNFANNEWKDDFCNDKYCWTDFEIEEINNTKILKKIFYLWRGGTILELNSSKISELNNNEISKDNYNRYKFVVVNEQYENIIKELRKDNIIRLIVEKGKNSLEEEKLYKKWLKKLTGQDKLCVRLIKDKNTIGCFKINNYIKGNSNSDCKKCLEVELEHSSKSTNEDKLSIRNHGVLMEKILKKQIDSIGSVKSISNDKIFDFLETIYTKIVIIDNRVALRLKDKKNKRNMFKNKLNFVWREENEKEFNENDNITDENLNFLIIHLSFIEALINNEKSDGKVIKSFIEKYEKIKELLNKENFYLVITTGRGRGEFLENVPQDYKGKVIFRPIASILSAIEDGIMLNDDFQIKYNLCKVIYGS